MRLTPGDIVMVHASMRKVGGRAEAAVRALLDMLGPNGTLVAYVDYESTPQSPKFDAARSPAAADHGVLAEVIRRWPGAIRSRNPGASMAAIGARAEWLCHPHPLRYGYGPGTPLGRLVDARGSVLLLGSDFDHVTLLHYAEHVAQLPNKRIIRDGDIEEFDTRDGVVAHMPPRYFATLTQAFIAEGHAQVGTFGHAQAQLLPAEPFVRFAVTRMERDLI